MKATGFDPAQIEIRMNRDEEGGRPVVAGYAYNGSSRTIEKLTVETAFYLPSPYIDMPVSVKKHVLEDIAPGATAHFQDIGPFNCACELGKTEIKLPGQPSFTCELAEQDFIYWDLLFDARKEIMAGFAAAWRGLLASFSPQRAGSVAGQTLNEGAKPENPRPV